jgi:aerobic C4-dicarboxylate transport protein
MHASAVSIEAKAAPGTQAQEKLSEYTAKAKHQDFSQFLLDIIPKTFVGAFTRPTDEGGVLQVLFLAILTGVALSRLGTHREAVVDLIHNISHVFFGIVGIVTKAAPIAAFAMIAFTVAKFGSQSLTHLGWLLVCVYGTSLAFIFVVLGGIARLHGFSIWRILKLIKDELLIVLGTSSSETALPLLMQKLKNNGCSESLVGIVVPSGYSFNLDGTSIYLTMAVLFISQATDTPLTLSEELYVLLILLLTSKGSAAVTGGGFITLAATLATTGKLPVSGLALIYGVDRFLSECRAITNLIGNTLASFIVAKWEGDFDPVKGRAVLANPPEEPAPGEWSDGVVE